MIIPNPAKITVVASILDEVSGDTHDETVLELFNGEVRKTGDRQISYGQRAVDLENITDTGDAIVGTSGTLSYSFRPVDTYDAVQLAPGAGCPQPISVVRAHILGGAALSQQLDAVVSPDNTVSTLMLETRLGTFVRFGGDWQELSSVSAALDDLALVQVGAGAVTVYDAAEAARTTVSVFDLPVPSSNDPTIMIEPEETVPGKATGTVSIPVIASAADMGMGIRFGNVHPESRWYVVKRAQALRATAELPSSWGVPPDASINDQVLEMI
jgi:hypothetical protein